MTAYNTSITFILCIYIIKKGCYNLSNDKQESDNRLENTLVGGMIDMPKTATMQKWGNSLGLRLPKDITTKMGIEQGTELNLLLDSDGRLIIEKAKNKFTLESLLEGCNDQNRPEYIDFGRHGKELL